MGRRSLLFPTFVSALVLALFVAWLRGEWGGPLVTQAFDDVAEIAAPLVAGVLCLVASRETTGRARRGWTLIGLSALSWASGQTVWTYYEVLAGQAVPFPSLADAGYLGAIPLAAVGMLSLIPTSTRPAARARALVDGVICATSILFVSWALVMRTVNETSTGTLVERAIALAYPLGDVIVGSLALFVASRADAASRRPIVLLAVAIVGLAISDSGFAYLTSTGDYVTGALIDAGWFAGYLVLGLAALSGPVRVDAEARARRWSTAAVILPFGSFFVAVLVAARVATTGGFDEFLVWVGVAAVLFLTLRSFLTLLDNRNLVTRLERANEALERVQERRVRLLAGLSRDLARPLDALRRELDEIAHAPTEGRAAALELARQNVDQLARLVGDVHDVGALAEGSLRLETQRVDLVALAQGAAESFRGAANDRQVTIKVRTPSYFPVRADGHRLRQVLYVLIERAIAATPAGGIVQISVTMVAGQARLVVEDPGSVEDGSVLDADAALGLQLARGIVEQHDGSLDAREGDAGGSVFMLTLPLERIVLSEPFRAPTIRGVPI